MLVLTRKSGEWIRIGNDIEIAILGIHSNQVKVGIRAPASMQILRSELLTQVQPDREQADSHARVVAASLPERRPSPG